MQSTSKQTVVITGANRGLGLEFCRQYLESGAATYACCRQPEQSSELLVLKQSYANQLTLIPLDITNAAQRQQLSYAVPKQVDILINNAGVYGPRDLSYDELTEKEWLEVLHVNAVAPLLVVQALADKIIQSNEKKIIFISSKMGSIADNRGGGSYIYRSSKTALNAAAKSLAVDLTSKEVAVSVLHPGWVRTDMGGANGLIDAPESVSGMRRVIDQLTVAQTGQFFNYDGSIIPW